MIDLFKRIRLTLYNFVLFNFYPVKTKGEVPLYTDYFNNKVVNKNAGHTNTNDELTINKLDSSCNWKRF